MQDKFKVGQRVRVVDYTPYNGETGMVLPTIYHGAVRVQLDSHHSPMMFYPNELELVPTEKTPADKLREARQLILQVSDGLEDDYIRGYLQAALDLLHGSGVD